MKNLETNISEGKLFCPKCNMELDELSILQNSKQAWPSKNWLQFKCASCKKKSHVEVKTGEISIGQIDGAPGPNFIRKCRKESAELVVSTFPMLIKCNFGAKEFEFYSKK